MGEPEHDTNFEDEPIEIVDLDNAQDNHARSGLLTWFKAVVGQQIQRHARALLVGLIFLLLVIVVWRSLPPLRVVSQNAQQTPQVTAAPTAQPVINNFFVPYTATNTTTYVIKADGTLSAFQTASQRVLWSRQLANEGTSFLVSSDQAVYRIESNSTSTRIEAYRTTDGAFLWQEMEISQAVPFQPMIQSDIIYMEGENGTIYAIQGENGRLLWHYEPYGGTAPGSVAPMTTLVHLAAGIVSIRDNRGNVHLLRSYSGIEIAYFYDSDVAYANWQMSVENSILYFSISTSSRNFDQSIYAYNINTDALLWQKTFSSGSLVWWSESSGKVFVSNGTLYVLRASDGTQLWKRTNMPADWLAATSSLLYIETPSNVIQALDVRTMHQQWQHRISPNIALLPMLSNGVLYFGPYFDSVEAWNANDGQKLWQYHSNGPLLWYPRIFGDTMYIQNLDGILVLARLNDGHVTWEYHL
jgi:outer membrane protein assembly factor BamB